MGVVGARRLARAIRTVVIAWSNGKVESCTAPIAVVRPNARLLQRAIQQDASAASYRAARLQQASLAKVASHDGGRATGTSA
jgi:hypothetical protein